MNKKTAKHPVKLQPPASLSKKGRAAWAKGDKASTTLVTSK